MKKTYGKPVISFENFAFSSNIAGTCADVFGIHTKNSACSSYGTFTDPNGGCEFIDNGFAIFYANNGECMMEPQESDPNNLCYHVSTAETKIFAS